MAHHEFLRKIGLFTVPGFLSPEECARLREMAESSEGDKARIYVEAESKLDETQRKSLDVAVQGGDKREIADRIEALRGEVERHFKMDLGGLDQIRCLLYQPGDFFALHADAATVESGKFLYLDKRRISVVVFLNEPQHPSEPYEGGELTFYGLMNVPGGKGFGFPVDAETGLLVAFPAETLHEVSPITRGKRFSMVTWFFRA